VGKILATDITRTIDARGMPCPGPLMSLIGAIREGRSGDIIEVLSSDAGSATDIPAWVAKAGHELREVVAEEGFTRFVVAKVR
jgi:TusA-related sulfurtransferase